MIDQRPYTNQVSSYIYDLYDTSLRESSSTNESVDLKINIEKSLLALYNGCDKEPSLLTSSVFDDQINKRSLLSQKKQQILDQIQVNKNMLATLRKNGKSRDLIFKSLSTLELLNDKLIQVDSQLDVISDTLRSHFGKIVSLSSIQDLVLNSHFEKNNNYKNPLNAGNISTNDIDSSFEFIGSSYLDELVSHVASVAAQRNINLPPPSFQDNSAEGKVLWVKMCIDSVLVQSNDVSVSTPLSAGISRDLEPPLSPLVTDSKETIILKTLLKDLQFLHQYLTKQFEEERSVNTQTMNSLRLKLQNSQDLLIKSNKELFKQSQNLINLEMQLNNADLEKQAKLREVADLTKRINLLQIDHLGEQQDQQSQDKKLLSPPSSKDGDYPYTQTPLSPITGFNFSPSTDDSHGLLSSRPGSNEFQLDSQQQLSKGSSSVSNSILRLEFKKLLNDINSKHEQELNAERNERKKLENLIKMMNDNNGTIVTTTDL